MNRTTGTLATLALASVCAIGGTAWAQEAQGQQKQGRPSGSQRQMPGDTTTGAGSEQMANRNKVPVSGAAEIVMTTGTIQSIDKDKRTVVLKDESGDQIKVQVPPDMPGFDQLKKGERVDLTYYDSIAVAFLPPGSAQPAAEARVHVEPAQAGGLVGREVTIAAQIVNVDTKNKAVELKLPNGQIQKVSVADADLQKQLRDLKPGQLATVTYTEAVAASLQQAQRGR
jgi:hypothetical protein